MPCIVESSSDTDSSDYDSNHNANECANEVALLNGSHDNGTRNDSGNEMQATGATGDNSDEVCNYGPTDDLLNEDYDEVRKRNIKEKEKMLSEIFQGVNMDEYKKHIRSPKPKQINRERKTPKTLILPRKHLPRRNASKAARERLSVDCFTDGDEEVNLSDEDEILENGKRRKIVVAFRSRAKRSYSVPLEPRLILSADDITEEDLKNVSDIVTEKVYSQNGTTCHQCRQKTSDMKTICRSEKCSGIRGYFCGPCLRNRYGEDARTALKDPNWECPPCKGICNCSICRNRAGVTATGILTPIAKRCGYASVKDYLNDHDKYIIKYEDE